MVSGQEYACVFDNNIEDTNSSTSRLCSALGPLPLPFLSLRSYWRDRVRNGSCVASTILKLLGYMDTLVHFGCFSLPVLVNTKFDSWLVAN